jgi:T-complex protein 1 subunit delta
MAVEAVLRILHQKRPDLLDLKDIRIVAKVGGTIDDSELVDGMVFSQKASRAAGGPTRIEKAQIGLIQVRPAQLGIFVCKGR